MLYNFINGQKTARRSCLRNKKRRATKKSEKEQL